MSNLPQNTSYGDQPKLPSTLSLKHPSAPVTSPDSATSLGLPKLPDISSLPKIGNISSAMNPQSSFGGDATSAPQAAPTTPTQTLTGSPASVDNNAVAQDSPDALFSKFKNLTPNSLNFGTSSNLTSSIASTLNSPTNTLFQKDHIVPTWLGGADTPDNTQSLFWNDADQRNAVNAVVKTLYDNKILGSKEAYANTIGWKERDTTGITPASIDANGNVPIDLAKKMLDKWQNPDAVTTSSVLAEVPGAIETVASKIMPPLLYDFGKGLLHAFSLGYINPGETNLAKFDTIGGVDTTNDVDRVLQPVARFGGDVAGNLFAFGALKAGLVAGATALAGGGEAAGLLGEGEAATKGVVGKVATKALQYLTATPAVTTFWNTLKDGSVALQATQSIIKPIVSDVVMMDLLGQMSKQDPNSSRLSRLLQDSTNAVAMNLVPKGIKGSLGTAFIGYLTTYTATGDEKQALENGVLFGGLHALGALHGGENISFEQAARENALEQANAIRAPYLERAGRAPADIFMEAATPEKTAKLKDALSQEFSITSDELYKQAEREGWDPQKFNTEQKKLILSYKFLQGETQITKAGYLSRSQETNWAKVNVPEAESKIPPEMKRPLTYSMASYATQNPDDFGLATRENPLPDVASSEAAQKEYPYFQKIQLTGYGSRIDPATGKRIPIDPITRQNIIDYNNYAQLNGTTPPIYLSTEPEAKYYIDQHNATVTPEDITNGTKQVYDPNDNLAAFYFDPVTKQFKRLGYVPTESYVGRVITNDNGSSTVSGMKYNQNQVIYNKNLERAKQGLPPFDYLSSNENNHTLRQAMDQNGIQVLKMRAEMPRDLGNGVGIGLESNEPYLHVATTDNFWAESALRNAGVDPGAQRWYNRPTLDAITKMSDYTTPPVEKLKQMPAVDRGDMPLTTDFGNADKIIQSRAKVIGFSDSFVQALTHGDAQAVKATVDKYIGEGLIDLHDARSLLAAKDSLTLNDLLPTNSKVLSLLQQGYNEGLLNANGEQLLQSFNFITKNDYEFYRNWNELKDKALIDNKTVDPAAPIAKEVTNRRVNSLVQKMSSPLPGPLPEKLSGEAIWRSKDTDTPVALTGKTQEYKGQLFAETEGGSAWIPAKELQFSSTGKQPLFKEEAATGNSAPPDFLSTKEEAAPITGKTSYTTEDILKAQRDATAQRESQAKPDFNELDKALASAPVAEAPTAKAVKASQVASPETMENAELPLANKLPKRRLASYESLSSILNIPEEELNAPSSWSENTNGVLKRPYNEITKAQQEALKVGDYETAAKLQENKGKFSKAYLELKAKEVYKQANGDAAVAFDKFKNDLNSYFKNTTGKDIVTDYEDSQDLKHQFNRMVDAIPTQKFSLTDKGFSVNDDSPAVASKGDRLIRNYEAKNNLKPGALSILSADTASSAALEPGMSASEKVDAITKAAADKDYIVFGTKNTGLDSLLAVKYNPDLVDKYNANPEKYKFTSDSGPLEGNDEKFFRVFAHDVLGLPNNLSADGVAKRWNLIFSREVADKSAPTTIHKIVLPSPTIGDVGGVDNGETKHLSSVPPELIQATNNKSLADGKKYITPERAKEIAEANGFPHDKQHFKSTTYHTFVDANGQNQAFIEKGDTAVMTPALKKFFEDTYGIKIEKNDEITFGDNVKIGKNIGDTFQTKLGEAKTVDVPNTSMSYKYVSEPSSESRFSPSTVGKFSAKDGVNQEFASAYKPTADRMKAMVSDVGNSGNGLDEAFKKYGINFSDNLFGAKQAIVKELGAGPKYMAKDVEETLIKNFADKAMDMSDKKSGHMYSSPDWGYKDGEATKYLKPGEVMISAEKAKDLGVSEGDSVLTWRNPVSRKTALYKAKVLVGENHGIDYLGRDHAIPSNHDITVRLEGDHDGDTLNFMKVGGQDGIPEKIANVVEAQRAKDGDILLPPLTPFPKKPLTVSNLGDIVKNQLMGSEGIGVTAANARVANMMVDNKISVKFMAPNAEGKTFYTVYRGDQPVMNSSIRPTEDGKPATSNTAPVTVSFTFDKDRQYLYTRRMQEAVDAIKSPDLANSGFNKEYLLNHSLTAEGPGAGAVSKMTPVQGQDPLPVITDPKIAGVLGREMQKLQSIFYVSNEGSAAYPKTMGDLIDKLTGFNKQTELASSGGAPISPIQEVARLFDGMKYDGVQNKQTKEIDSALLDRISLASPHNSANLKIGDKVNVLDAEKNDRWKAASNAVKAELGEKMAEPLASKEVQQFIDKAKKAQTEYNLYRPGTSNDQKAVARETARNKLIQHFYENEKNYTPEQKDAIVYWLTTDPSGNIVNEYLGGKDLKNIPFFHTHVRLYDELLPQSPIVGKAFFKAFEK